MFLLELLFVEYR